MQPVALSDTQVAVQLLSSVAIAGVQFETTCILGSRREADDASHLLSVKPSLRLDRAESGEEAFVEILSGGGGITLNTDFSVVTASQGQWLVFSLDAPAIAPGFYLLATLETESLSAKGCQDGSIKLVNGEISDPMVMPLEMQRVECNLR